MPGTGGYGVAGIQQHDHAQGEKEGYIPFHGNILPDYRDGGGHYEGGIIFYFILFSCWADACVSDDMAVGWGFAPEAGVYEQAMVVDDDERPKIV